MEYIGQIWRPPSEASSLILQVTVGCSHNQCTFCTMYKAKKFYIKSMETIKAEIEEAAQLYPEVRRIFLADGDALQVPTKELLEILQFLQQCFPRITRVTTYASPKSILKKSVDELIQLKEAKLKMAYLGLESGHIEILKRIKKGVTPEMMIEAGQRLKQAGIKSSVTVILGLGGRSLTKEHARATALVVNAMQPNYLSALTLMVTPNTPIYEEIENEELILLDTLEIMQELYNLIEGINLPNPCIFRSNHASNYIAVNGTLPKDKERMLTELKDVLNHPKEYYLKEEWMRGL
ncbi:MAG: B12-binding domain-containing radical SAM protein [Halanaerobiales bacterium]|nr:B12-binding domain-containing radical SAM protein [Halanaerobiales bacterium]